MRVHVTTYIPASGREHPTALVAGCGVALRNAVSIRLFARFLARRHSTIYLSADAMAGLLQLCLHNI